MPHGRAVLTLMVLCGLPGPLLAQESPGYRLREHALNEGGSPAAGVEISSAGYRISLAALGGAAGSTLTLSSPGYRAEAGFVPPYRPPGECVQLVFQDAQTLAWDPERSVGAYNLYRGLVSDLGAGYGSCLQAGLAASSALDASVPAAGAAYFYLATAENRLAEEGTLGVDGALAERPNTSPCP